MSFVRATECLLLLQEFLPQYDVCIRSVGVRKVSVMTTIVPVQTRIPFRLTNALVIIAHSCRVGPRPAQAIKLRDGSAVSAELMVFARACMPSLSWFLIMCACLAPHLVNISIVGGKLRPRAGVTPSSPRLHYLCRLVFFTRFPLTASSAFAGSRYDSPQSTGRLLSKGL